MKKGKSESLKSIEFRFKVEYMLKDPKFILIKNL